MSDADPTAPAPKRKPAPPRRKAATATATPAAAAPAAIPAVPPVAAKPVAAKPVVVKPVAVKPAAAKPVVETPVAAKPATVTPTPEPVPVTAAAEIIPPSKPVAEAPVSFVVTTPASPPHPAIKQTVKLMATLPTPPFKGYEELAAFSKANMEAFVQANTILAKGFEEISKEVMALTKASMETASTTAKAVFAAKTIKDVVDLQSDYAKSSFDKFVANSSKLSELGVKVASDAIAPVTARVNVAVEKVLKPAA